MLKGHSCGTADLPQCPIDHLERSVLFTIVNKSLHLVYLHGLHPHVQQLQESASLPQNQVVLGGKAMRVDFSLSVEHNRNSRRILSAVKQTYRADITSKGDNFRTIRNPTHRSNGIACEDFLGHLLNGQVGYQNTPIIASREQNVRTLMVQGYFPNVV